MPSKVVSWKTSTKRTSQGVQEPPRGSSAPLDINKTAEKNTAMFRCQKPQCASGTME